MFRFDAETHTYWLDERKLPHITGLLTVSGWADDRWFTEESSERGRCVHQLTAEYDLGALDVDDCVSPFRGYLLGHVALCKIVRPWFRHIEVPFVHEQYGFGGRPDRAGQVYGAAAVVEVKSGGPTRAHQIQTALQAILVAGELQLPAEAVQRYAEYLQPRGRFKLEQHKDRRDFDEARRILRRYC